jgi:hypothetical protein
MKQIEMVERYQNMINTQLQIIQQYSNPGNNDSDTKKKLNAQLENMIDGLSKASASMAEKISKKS